MKKLIAIFTAFLVTISLTSCGGPSPTDISATFLDGIKEFNPKTIASVYATADKDKIDDLDLDEEDQAMLDRLNEDPFNKMLAFDYDLSNEQIKDDKATVDVTITTFDLSKPYENFMKKFFLAAFSMDENTSDEEMTEKMITLAADELKPLTEKTYTKTATIDLVKVDDQWKIAEIDDNEDLINALTGGLLDLMNATDNIFN